ncbi:carboxypeptidase-like regulatory domain-containing protein [Maribacter aestuarii]|uniref:carboxypeptidase-like regulatory domain-containing protein n=1 Tax=Maribacter aestuarii TaxID=1130723 RepID=UPI00248CB610|nr:carboxypeptidase-like regulatory domain-containing protein [Maribacter aestuarii]
MLLRPNIWICFLLLCSKTIIGQDNNFLRGRVLDRTTGEPVIFATVRIKDKARGVITNMDGSFRLPMTYRGAGESIEISSMGYEKKEYELLKLSPRDINIIRLSPGVLSLTEAVVKGKKPRKLSAVQIVRRAIKAIPKNYPTREFAAIGYYRDYQIRKDNYVNLNEAIFEVVDKGFLANDHLSSKIRIYDYLNNKDFKQDFEGKFKYDYKYYKKFIDKAYLYNYGGNEFTILRIHDAIRNHNINSFDFINVLEKDFIDNHFFNKKDDIWLGDEVLYTINFSQSLQKYVAYGKIYISKRDYAIHKMEYEVFDRYRKMEEGKLNEQGDNYETIFEVTTEYARKYGKMYPNYISFFNTFEVGKPPEFIVEDVLLDGPKRCFVVEFNDFVDIKTAASKGNYNIRLNGNRLKIEKVKVFDIEVEVYPDLSDKEFTNLVLQMETKQRKRIDFSNIFSVEVTHVENKKGTKVNEMQYDTYRQFREFFVQEIKPNGSVLKDTLFMKKDVPIFKEQPITKPDNVKGYWMNTPLKSINK